MFYGVMALVAATCIVNIGPFTALKQHDWFEAWGSWVSGVGTFLAAGVALYVSTQDRRDRSAERAQELRFRRHFAAFRLLHFTEELRGQLEELNIGDGTDEASWCVLRDLDREVARLRLSIRPCDIPDIMYLGTLCEDGIELDRDIDIHNRECAGVATEINLRGKLETLGPMRRRLVDIEERARALGDNLVSVLNDIYNTPDYESWRHEADQQARVPISPPIDN